MNDAKFEPQNRETPGRILAVAVACEERQVQLFEKSLGSILAVRSISLLSIAS
jgi:hypothetical protein